MIKTDKYITNIKKLIENNIIETKKRNIQIENDKLSTYWNIGRQIVEARNENKIKYGNSFIKEMSKELTKIYGKGYDYTNLRKMRQFYLAFPKCASVGRVFITWTHMKSILPIKDENKRNYYINLVNENKLSVRQLKEEIKNNAFERLNDNVKKNIKLNKDDTVIPVIDFIKDPLLIDLSDLKDKELSEKALHKAILEQIEKFLLELGVGFAFVGSEVKLKVGNSYRYIDLLFFNIEENCYVAIELKINKLKPSDIGQLQFYINYINDEIKKPYHNRTIGILICNKNDKNISKYLNQNNIKITSYKIK